MSTRSGKRIHCSFHENIMKEDTEVGIKSERKTRSKRLKENFDTVNITSFQSKKRDNYVSYPTDDELISDVVNREGKNTSCLSKNALKEHNFSPTINSLESNTDTEKFVRLTRRTKKFTENASEDVQETENDNNKNSGAKEMPISKKNKKKKTTKAELVDGEEPVKKKTKKKKGRKSVPVFVEKIDQNKEGVNNNTSNRSNMSVDSFHSAAGSPVHNRNLTTKKSPRKISKHYKLGNVDDNKTDDIFDNMEKKVLAVIDTTLQGNVSLCETLSESTDSIVFQNNNNNFDKVTTSHRSSITDTSMDKGIISKIESKNFSFDSKWSNPFDTLKKRKSLINNSTFEKKDTLIGATFESPPKETTNRNSSINGTFDSEVVTPTKINTTFDKDAEFSSVGLTNNKMSALINTMFNNDNIPPLIMDTTFEKASPTKILETQKRKSSIKDSTYHKDLNSSQNNLLSMNTCFESKYKRKSNINGNLNSTFDKSTPNSTDTTYDKDKKLDTTFDKNSKSSIISSDRSNITDDDVSCISITTDDFSPQPSEKTSNFDQFKGNIMNTTPLLIESSIDESLVQDNSEKLPITPLKREGTFTKEGPEVTAITPTVTPTKRMSLPSPGCTPFPLKHCHKDKSVLNITRSIEKGRRSSSLVEPVPRTTKVMFCSPVNNPVVAAQYKRKVIKSNLKGSNKSFVFEESERSGHPSARKRSYTQSDVEEASVKRKRLADDLQQSVDRLSRPRTSSASAKLSESVTPSTKKPTTPSKTKSEAKVARTKLPNFAILHQKQFDKMESLDECQERKSKRARQLLTPTGAVTVLERSSPKGLVTESQKPVKETSKKPETSLKSLSMLDLLKPGYTRFGFKLNLDVNPFSIPSKNADVKTKEKPKGLLRQATLPSLAGATSARREVAKQVIMREKSFTDKRNMKRNENRTIIKGVRTNRRFELQMKLRKLD